MAETHNFQAEIKQLLNILVHSLYKDREIFLRELISNASDALNRVRFEMLTNDAVYDKETELAIDITVDEANHTIQISDSGIGMTAEEMVNGLGVIARSGARAFLERVGQSDNQATATEIIGQFGVGFYSVFMVADRVEVTSRSYLPDAQAARWVSSGEDSYEIDPAKKEHRGTDIVIHLREDAYEFASEWRLREIIKRHSDYINFPVYLHKAGTEQTDSTPINEQTALWRQSSDQVDEEAYSRFYTSLTLDAQPPRRVIHFQAEAPLQFYALLFVPRSSERSILTPRVEPGLKLYARKVLIDENNTDLLPDYLWFIQGVVDSEDLPLNVSRETVQANPLIGKLKNVLTRRVLNEFKELSEKSPDDYNAFWQEYRNYLKHGVASDFGNRERLLTLLRFAWSRDPEALISLETYVETMVKGQEAIYYVVGDDVESASRSVHLDPFRARDIPVLFLTDTIDGLLVPNLREHKGHKFVAVDADDLDLEGIGQKPEESQMEAVENEEMADLISYIIGRLGQKVKSVRVGKMLSQGPVRLVTPAGSMDRHQQRLYRMLDKEVTEAPRILEINPHHPLIHHLAHRFQANHSDPLLGQGVDMLYELAMLADGIHPNPSLLASDLFSILQLATRPEDGMTASSRQKK